MNLFTENSKLIAECSSVFGGLKGDVRNRLLALLNNPCQETWEKAHTILITGVRMSSLWQAVLAVDPFFPRSKPCDKRWPRIPDQFTLCRAIRQAMKVADAEQGKQTA